jgi:hypothetical protein
METRIKDASGTVGLLEAEQVILERAKAVSQSIVMRVHEITADSPDRSVRDQSNDSRSACGLGSRS